MEVVLGTAVVDLVADTEGLERDMRRAAREFERIGADMQRVGSTLSRSITLPILAAAGAMGKAAIDFESSFAGIRKTMDLTVEEFDRLAQANRDLAKEIPVSVNELNRIGELAGQLGIEGVDNVLKFEETIAQLAVTTDLTADQGALAFAQIANVIQLPQDQIDRLGAAVVGLGNNFATVESRIVDFTQRIAGAGAFAEIGAGELAGIATAFASMGVNAEAGGTAVQKVLLSMVAAVEQGGDELRVFAETANQTTAEFADAFRRDAAGAFTDFVEGLGTQGNAAIQTLEELGLQDQRLARSFLAAASAGDLLRRAIAQGRDEFQANNALVEEAGKRFETAASQLTIFWNQLKDVAITLGTALLPVLTDALRAMGPLVAVAAALANVFASMPQPLRTAVAGLAAVAAAIGPLQYVIGSTLTALGALTKSFAVLAGISLTKAVAGWVAAFASLAVQVRSVAAAVALLQASIGPAGWLVAGVTAVTGVLGLLGAAIAITVRDHRRLRAAAAETAATIDAAVDSIGGLNQAAASATVSNLSMALADVRQQAAEAAAELRQLRDQESGGQFGVAQGAAQAEGSAEIERLNREAQQLETLLHAAVARMAELGAEAEAVGGGDAGGGIRKLTEEELEALKASEELVAQLRIQVAEQDRLRQATAEGARALAMTTAELDRERDLRDALRTAVAAHADEVTDLVNRYHDLEAATRSQQAASDLSQQVEDQRRLADAAREGAEASADMARVLQFEATLRASLAQATDEQRAQIQGLVVEYFNLVQATDNATRVEATRQRMLGRRDEIRDMRGLVSIYEQFEGSQKDLEQALRAYNRELEIRRRIEAELAQDPNQDVAALAEQVRTAVELQDRVRELGEAGEQAAFRWENAFVAAIGSIRNGVTGVVQTLLGSLSQLQGSAGVGAAAASSLVGLFSGLFDNSAEEQAREAQEEALRRSIDALDDFAASLRETSDLQRNLQQAAKLAFDAFVKEFSTGGGVPNVENIERLAADLGPFIEEMVRAGATIQEILEAVAAEMITNADTMGALTPAIVGWVDAMRAAQKAHEKAQERFQNDLEIRRLEALGLDEQARARRRELEIMEAQARGFDDATIAALAYTQALEEQALLMDKASSFGDAFQAGIAQRARREGDIPTLRAIGEAEIAEMIAGFEELVQAGLLTEEEVLHLALILRENLNAELASIAEQAALAAEAIREAARAEQFRAMIDTQNLRVQLLQIQGRTREAIVLQNQIALLQAIQEERGAEYIALLQQIGAERLRQHALQESERRQREAQQAAEGLNRALTGTVSALNAPSGLRLSLLRWRSLMKDTASDLKKSGDRMPAQPRIQMVPPETMIVQPSVDTRMPANMEAFGGSQRIEPPDFDVIEPPALSVMPEYEVIPPEPLRVTPEFVLDDMLVVLSQPQGGGAQGTGSDGERVIEQVIHEEYNFGGVTIVSGGPSETPDQLLDKLLRAGENRVRRGGADPWRRRR